MGFKANSQTFFPAPSALLEQELAFDQAGESYIYFNNPSGDTLTLRWRLLESSIPEGWDIDLCDYGACYIGIPGNGTMNPIYGATQAYLKLIAQPGAIPGAAWIWFRVFEKNNDTNFQDVFYSLHTPGTSPTQETTPNAALRISPNPASDYCIFENTTSDTYSLYLTDGHGRPLVHETLTPQQTYFWNTAALPSGLYVAHFGHKTQKIIVLH